VQTLLRTKVTNVRTVDNFHSKGQNLGSQIRKDSRMMCQHNGPTHCFTLIALKTGSLTFIVNSLITTKKITIPRRFDFIGSLCRTM